MYSHIRIWQLLLESVNLATEERVTLPKQGHFCKLPVLFLQNAKILRLKWSDMSKKKINTSKILPA